MACFSFIWTDRVIARLALFDLSTDDVEDVVNLPFSESISHSTGRPVAFGYISDGRYIMVVYDEIDDDTVQVATAYPVPEP